MIVKNQEAIDRMVFRLRAILETDKGLSADEVESIQMALEALEPIATHDTAKTYPSRLADHP